MYVYICMCVYACIFYMCKLYIIHCTSINYVWCPQSSTPSFFQLSLFILLYFFCSLCTCRLRPSEGIMFIYILYTLLTFTSTLSKLQTPNSECQGWSYTLYHHKNVIHCPHLHICLVTIATERRRRREEKKKSMMYNRCKMYKVKKIRVPSPKSELDFPFLFDLSVTHTSRENIHIHTNLFHSSVSNGVHSWHFYYHSLTLRICIITHEISDIRHPTHTCTKTMRWDEKAGNAGQKTKRYEDKDSQRSYKVNRIHSFIPWVS